MGMAQNAITRIRTAGFRHFLFAGAYLGFILTLGTPPPPLSNKLVELIRMG